MGIPWGAPQGRRRRDRSGSLSGWPGRRVAGFCILIFAAAATCSTAQTGGEAPDLTHPLTVDQLVQIALARNLDLAQAQQSVRGAHGAYVSSWSGLLPSANLNYGYSRSIANSSQAQAYYDPALQQVVQVANTVYNYNYGLGVSGGVNVIDLPSIYSHQQARHGLKASQAALADARTAIALSVRQQYYTLVGAKQLARVDDDATDLAQEQLKRSQSLYELGSVARSDVLQAQVNVATSQRDQISAHNSIEQQRAKLAVLLALPVDAPLEVADPPPVPDSLTLPSEADLIKQAREARPDLRQAREALESARLSESTAKARRYPSLGGSYSYSKQRQAADEALSQFGRDYRFSFSLGVSLLLFDGLSTEGRVEQAAATRQADVEALRARELQVDLEVREAVLQIKNASEEIRSARQGVSFAEESVRLQKALYENGGGTLLEWNNAQVALTRARVAQVQAESDLQSARAGLSKALGETIE